MPVKLNRPIASEFLSDSQPVLLSNNNDMDSSFGTDHVAASNTGTDNGRHAVIQSVEQASHPSTTTQNKTYAVPALEAIPPLVYTRGINDAVPSPLTKLQSTAALISLNNGVFTTILDFANITYAYGVVYVSSLNPSGLPRFSAYVFNFISGATGVYPFIFISSNFSLQVLFSGSELRVLNGTGATWTDIAWTLEFQRIQI
jgi:hypothetical protein